MRYAIVIEKTPRNYSAYVPDLPGCVATGKSAAMVRRRIRVAIELHLAGMHEDRLRIPRPTARAQYVDAIAPRRKAG
jgi:predicted RNase H-like HicB family nuclease